MTYIKELEKLTVKQLADLAKNAGINGWSRLRKDELINALKKIRSLPAKKKTAKKKSDTAQTRDTKKGSGKKSTEKSTAAVKKTAGKKAIPVKKSPKSVTKPSRAKTKSAAQTEKKTSKAKTTAKSTSRKPPLKKANASTPPATTAKRRSGKSEAPPKSDAKLKATSGQSQSAQHQKSKSSHVLPGNDVPQNTPAASPVDSIVRMTSLKESLIKYRELSGVFDSNERKDRLVLMVRDSYWLHAFWELNVKLVERAKAAMGAYWHTATPILRLYRIMADGISKQRRVHQRDIKLQGYINNWYIDVHDPPASFMVEIGYISSKGKFFPLASSNTIETPENHSASHSEPLDGNWIGMAYENDRALQFGVAFNRGNVDLKDVFDEPHAKRSIPTPLLTRFSGTQIETVNVEIEADIVIYGKTQPDVQLVIKNEPIRLQPDGRFSVRFHLPEKRQVYPIVAISSDGIESQTTILAIERNTKALETVYREHDDLD